MTAPVTPEATAATVEEAIVTYIAVVPDTGAILPQDHFTYAVPAGLAAAAVPGARVEVTFGRRDVVGYVVGRERELATGDARLIAAVLDEPPILDPAALALARWIAERYCSPLGEVIRAMLPKGVRAARPGGRKRQPRTTSAAMHAARAGESEPGETPRR